MASRSNVTGANLRECMIWEKNKFGQVKQTLTGTYTMDAKSPHLLWLDPGGAGRTVLLPAEAAGAWFLINNQADAIEDLTVKEDAGVTTIGIVKAGQGTWFFCDGTTWYTLSDTGSAAGSVIVADAASYTVLAANSGRTHILPDVTSSITVTLPTPDEGLEYTFIYGGVAADAQNHLFTGGAGNFLKGNILMADTDAGAGADEMSVVFGNGSSHITLTVTTPGYYEIRAISDGALWYVTGTVGSATVCAFS